MRCLEVFVGIVDCNESCENVLKKFLQAKGLWLFRWAQVRRDVWRGILQGSSKNSGSIQRICLSSSPQGAFVCSL